MSEIATREFLRVIYEEWADYGVIAAFARSNGESRLCEFNKGGRAALRGIIAKICEGFGEDFGEDCMKEENMSEGILVEVLDFVRQDKKSYEVTQDKARKMGDNDLYNFCDGAQSSLQELENFISGYLGEDCSEEEEHE